MKPRARARTGSTAGTPKRTRARRPPTGPGLAVERAVRPDRGGGAKKRTALFCVLDWGLGHATRSIPLMRGLADRGWRLVIVSTRRPLTLLRAEFPDSPWVDLPDYRVRYVRNRHGLVPHLLIQVPRILFRLITEQPETETLVRRYGADAVVSDNRYGCFSRRVPSFLITHQLRFQLPPPIRWSAFISEGFNGRCFTRFKAVFVPDQAGAPNLSGDLSHRGAISRHPKLRYLGPLSSLHGRGGAGGRNRLDTLILVSGPEPSRTMLEEIVLAQAPRLGGVTAVVLGKPENGTVHAPSRLKGLTVYDHLDRGRLADLMRGASVVVANSGYSTIMELAAFGKKALLIPTPGQTEQEYLARHARESGLFYSVPQEGLNLETALAETAEFYRHAAPVRGLGANGIEKALDLITESGASG